MKATKTLILLFFFLAGRGFAQEGTEPKFFAQCMVNITDETSFRELEESIRQNPYASVVRLDWVTKRAFIITKDLTQFNEQDFLSWFGESAANISCVQTGVFGVDEIAKYPFTNCSN